MKIDGGAVRMGMVIEWEKRLWMVVKHEIRTPGNLRSFNQVELKDIKTGTKNTPRFSSSEKIERVTLDSRTCSFLFADGDDLTFMDSENYEQFVIKKDFIGDSAAFLQDGMSVDVQTYEETPLSIALPHKVNAKVAEADPVIKGQTVSSSYKPAVLENGVRVMVPPFIPAGETIVVDTRTMEYVERAKVSS